jgi:hypothetical protein
VIRRAEIAAAAIVAIAVLPAPTVGDIGGCGKTATALDPGVFAHARKTVDCRRCSECALGSERCVRACDPQQPSDVDIPPTCHPLYHDGEVCIRALEAASCSDYATYVDDVAPAIPSECDFCRIPPEGGAP